MLSRHLIDVLAFHHSSSRCDVARFHVSDVGSNTAPFDTWAKAATNITNATILAATGGTDEIWVDKDHTEGASATTNVVFTGGTLDDPIEVYSIDKDASDAYVPGALINTTVGNLVVAGHARIFGVDWTASATGGDISVNTTGVTSLYFQDATLTADDIMKWDASGSESTMVNCVLSIGDVSDGIRLVRDSMSVYFRNCVVTHGAAALLRFQGQNTVAVFEDCDLTTDSDNLIQHDSADVNNNAIFRRCSLKSGYSLFEDAPKFKSWALVESSTAATDATPLGLQEYADYFGTVKSTLVQRRDTDGADDGVQANEHSWVMVANAKTREFWRPLKSPPITVWVAGGSELTFKIFVASTAAVQNDECWIELSGPDNTATSTTRGYRETTKMGWTTSIDGDPQATPVDLATDEVDDWVGTDTGTPQEMEITYTPDQAGPVTIRVCLAVAAGKTLYVDPKIEVT